MGEPNSARGVGNEVPPAVRDPPAQLPDHAHRLLDLLRAAVPAAPPHLLQHAHPDHPIARIGLPLPPLGTQPHPHNLVPLRLQRRRRRRQCHTAASLHLDGQRPRQNALVHPRKPGRGHHRRPEAVPRGLHRLGTGPGPPRPGLEGLGHGPRVADDPVDPTHGAVLRGRV